MDPTQKYKGMTLAELEKQVNKKGYIDNIEMLYKYYKDKKVYNKLITLARETINKKDRYLQPRRLIEYGKQDVYKITYRAKM